MSYRTKRSLYTISKYIIRLCLLALAVYVVASVLFYFIGQSEFSALQEKVFSYTLTYLIPFLLLFGLAGTYLFKVGDDEDEPQRIRQQRKTTFSPLLATLLGVILIIFAIYKFGFKKSGESYVAASKASGVAATQRPGQQNQVDNDVNEGERNDAAAQPVPATLPATDVEQEAKPVVKQEVQKDSVIVPPSKSSSNRTVNPSRTSGNDKADYTSVEVRYKVISKAYLHNAPDANTRRSAFINYNNSYSTLIPKGEKNGFVYVVFSNDKGQTTMGWLNKKDLRPVNEVVYNDSK